jgi:hypothetical protein
VISQDHGRISELMDCFFDPNLRICQRAAWPVGDLGEKYPTLLIPYLPALIENLKTPKHNAIMRNTVRTWQNMPIPEEFQGAVFEICFEYIIDPKIPIAVRAFSMTVCANICNDVPELKEELKIAIEDQLEFGSPGIRSRGNKILKQLEK